MFFLMNLFQWVVMYKLIMKQSLIHSHAQIVLDSFFF